MNFQDFGFHPSLLNAIEKCGYKTPTPIQAEAIPVALQGNDILACAQTGTGKTAAFVLPSLSRLAANAPLGNTRSRGPRVLILTPTRELAMQVNDAVVPFAKALGMRTGVVMGGVPYATQFHLLSQPLDVLVATPGRLIDHMKAKRIDFSRIEVVVLDEADRMLDMGFVEPVEMIVGATSAERQTLMFSATFSREVERIAAQILKNPVRVHLAPAQMNHDAISQHMFRVDDLGHKHAVLKELLDDPKIWQAIVFTATKIDADELADKLYEMGHATGALHGDMRQNVRKRTISQMHRGDIRVLVATDVAARGLDVKELTHVINFDLPMVAEDYVHRIGRTGRGGATGTAISLVGPKDMSKLRNIERLIGKPIERRTMEGLEPQKPEREWEDRKPSKFGGKKRSFGGRSGAAFSRDGQSARSMNGMGFGNGHSRFGGGRSEGGYASHGARDDRGGYAGRSERADRGGYAAQGGHGGRAEGGEFRGSRSPSGNVPPRRSGPPSRDGGRSYRSN